MGHGLDYDNIFAIGLGSLVALAGVHSFLTLLIKNASVKGWRHVEGQLQYLNEYKTYIYGRGYKSYNGTNLEAEYSYAYGQAQFKGEYVSVIDLPPRLWAAEYRDLYPGLEDAYKNKKPISVLVNPEKPHQAVLAAVPVSSAVLKACIAMTVGGGFLLLVQTGIPAPVTWVYGATAGFAVYLLFAAGLLSTCF